MNEKFEKLATKVEQVLDRLDEARRENAELTSENVRLRAELASLNKEHDALKLVQADRAGQTRTKLLSVLDRLDQLEKLGG